MAKKSDSFYYDNFSACATYAFEAASMLDSIMRDFDPEKISEAIEHMHAIEQAADEKKHEMGEALITAFITPIEREDIDALSHGLDSVVDHIEGVLHRIYFDNIQEMREDALAMTKNVMRACQEMQELVKELPQFKKSKTLHKHVVSINDIEEESDMLYITAMRELHAGETDPLQVIAWRDVYTFLEYCADSCEHVAELVETIVMKNS